MEKYVDQSLAFPVEVRSQHRDRKRLYVVTFFVLLAMSFGVTALFVGRQHTTSDQTRQSPGTTQLSPQHESRFNYYVAPNGSNTNNGLSAEAPFKTIQHALDIAKPDTTIHLAPGKYRETLTTKAAGKPGAPIIVEGGDEANQPDKSHHTVLFGTGRIINLNHSYYVFEGFAVDGQEKLAGEPYPTDPADMNAYKDSHQSLIKDGRLFYIGSADSAKDITGVTITNMLLQGGGGECVRFRNNSFGDSVTDSVIRYCGLFAKKNSDDRFLYHNGEGVYIGTSPKSSSQPAHGGDASHDILVADNTIDTYGSECVDIKENAHDNTVRHNLCRYNLEPLEYDGSNLEIRGDHNSVIDNTIKNSAGWNLKLVSDSSKYDRGGNSVQNNSLGSADGNVNVYIKQLGSKLIVCGNTIDGTTEGISVTVFTSACTKN